MDTSIGYHLDLRTQFVIRQNEVLFVNDSGQPRGLNSSERALALKSHLRISENHYFRSYRDLFIVEVKPSAPPKAILKICDQKITVLEITDISQILLFGLDYDRSISDSEEPESFLEESEEILPEESETVEKDSEPQVSRRFFNKKFPKEIIQKIFTRSASSEDLTQEMIQLESGLYRSSDGFLIEHHPDLQSSTILGKIQDDSDYLEG